MENLENFIKDIFSGNIIEQKISLLLDPGENYASVLYKIDFKVRENGEDQEYHAVAKCCPPNISADEDSVAIFRDIFKLEIAWYNTVIPTLIHFQKDKGVKNPIDFFQNLYGTRRNLNPLSDIVDENAIILSENLKYLGYTNVNRYTGFDLLTTHTILSNLATFHAVPLAIRYHQPEKFDTYIKPYLSAWAKNKEMDVEFLESVYKIYRHIPEYNPLMDRIRKTLDESNIFQKRVVREPWGTAIHMDFWSNNIMLTDSKPPKTIILDFQCPGFASPTADLSFFLLTSVKHDVIKDNFDNLVKFYYEEFIRNLKELKVSIEQFSFEAFLSEFNTEVKMGEFAHALGHIAVIYSETDTTATDDSSGILTLGKIHVNDKHINKIKWITAEAVNRKWV